MDLVASKVIVEKPGTEKEINDFRAGNDAERAISVVDVFEDGSLLVEARFFIEPKIDDLTYVVNIFKSGVTFEDGSRFKGWACGVEYLLATE